MALGRARLHRLRKKLWFWVEQRFQRCVKAFQSNQGLSPWGTRIKFFRNLFSRAAQSLKIP
jgi:hypothetical protein